GGVRESADATEALLSYENFNVTAQLNGDTAQVSTSTALMSSSGDAKAKGNLKGEAKLIGLQGASPKVDGHAELNIDDLAPIALFALQLAEVAGHADGRVAISGPLKAPDITGEARVQQFAAEVPTIGLRLHDGEVTVAMKTGNKVSITGQLSS